MKKAVTICMLLICQLLIAQQKFNATLISPKLKIENRKSSHNSLFTVNNIASDTLDEFVVGDQGGLGNLTFDVVPPYDTGYWVGTNSIGLNTSLQRFDIKKSGTMSDILLGFGIASGSGSFTVSVRADSMGMPGHIIESFPVLISQIDMLSYNPFGDSITSLGWNCKTTLPTPLHVMADTSIWIGLSINGFTNGDTLSMICSTPGTPAPANYSYQIFHDTAMYSFSSSTGGDVVLSIFPVIEYPIGQIKGNIFNDLNGNNVKDSSESGLANIKVTAGNFISYTDVFGNYTIYTDSGNYIVKAPITYAIETPSVLSVFVPDSGISVGNDFAIHYIPNVRDLEVSIIPGVFRPGFYGDYFLSIKNNGTQTDSGTVSITLDDSLQFNSSLPTPTNITGNIITFNYPPLNQGQNALLYISSYIPSTLGLNYALSSSAIINPLANDSNISNNYDTIIHITQGSYDPNIKQVLPSGDISPTFVSNGNYLNYTIQFQNTGTDTAFNINVVDTLSSNLDITTLEVLNASNKYITHIRDNQIVTFSFPNILLLDSSSSEPKSHGFVSYRIKPKNNLVIGDQISNTAYIYFDFNAPVVTGTTINTVSVTTSSINQFNNNNDVQTLSVFPNPVANDLTLSFNESGNYTVKIYDILGAIKLNTNVKNSKTYKIDLSTLTHGCYIITAEGAKGVVYRTKIIKQ